MSKTDRAKMTLNKFGFDYFTGLKAVLENLPYREIGKFVKTIWQAYKKEKTIFFCGNGGSAATASHLAADIGKNTVMNGKARFKTMALTDNVAWLTAVGNDLAYEDIFVEQLKNFGQKNDVLVVVSGSGNSPNVIKAIKWATTNGLKTVGLLGFHGGKAKKMIDVCVLVPVEHYGYVEGVHSEIHHFLVEALKLLVKNDLSL